MSEGGALVEEESSTGEKRVEPGLRYVVIGGGIAGVSCAQELSRLVDSDRDSVLLITASPLLKAVENVRQLGQALQSFDVVERPTEALAGTCKTLIARVTGIDPDHHLVIATGDDGSPCHVAYDRVCIAAGARPRMLFWHPRLVVGIRDTQSVADLAKRMATARRVCVAGNGGIALEFVYATDFCECVWAIRHTHIGSRLFDANASGFFLDSLACQGKGRGAVAVEHTGVSAAAVSHGVAAGAGGTTHTGTALGPNWMKALGRPPASVTERQGLTVEFESIVVAVREGSAGTWKVRVGMNR
jgi:pyridine nucleotide-disulfide oxidoreductase domain-containing protein 1